MLLIYSTATIPAVLLLVFGAVLLAVRTLPKRPQGELVYLDDLLTEEDDS
jgi:hypothetical protein